MPKILHEGIQLRLRQAEPEDIDYIMALEYAPENVKYIVPFTREIHMAAIKDAKSTMDVIVERKEDGAPVGYLMISGMDNAFRKVEWTHVVIGEKNKGYGHEAMKLIKAWSFDDMHFHRGWLDCKEYNAAALHLYESEGMQREGLLRETICTNGVYENLIVLGILDREFRARQKEGQELPETHGSGQITSGGKAS